MVTINDSSLSQNVYETIYDDLKAKATASSYGTSVQPTITAAYIDDSPVANQIVINPVVREKDSYCFGQNNPDTTIMVLIDIYCIGSGRNKNIDILSDNVDTFTDSEYAGLQLTSKTEATNYDNINNNKVRMKTLSLTYKRK